MKLLYYIFCTILTQFQYGSPQRIGEGEEVSDPTRFPFFAMFIITTRTNNSHVHRHTCGGSLIHLQWVLTAGHCLPNNTNDFDKLIKQRRKVIFMGSIFRPSKENFDQARRIIEIYRHPNYIFIEHTQRTVKTLKNDIAVLKVHKPFIISDTVDIIHISTTFRKYKHGIAIGIGSIDWTHKQSHIVKFAELEINPSYDKEKTTFTAISRIKKKKQHHKHYSATGYALADDSGGPFICKDVSPPLQIGIISMVRRDDTSIVTNTIERVDNFLEFIMKHVPIDKKTFRLIPNGRGRAKTVKRVSAGSQFMIYPILYLYFFLFVIMY